MMGTPVAILHPAGKFSSFYWLDGVILNRPYRREYGHARERLLSRVNSELGDDHQFSVTAT